MTRLKKLNVPVAHTALAALAVAGTLSAVACGGGGESTMGTGGTGTGGNGTGGMGTGGMGTGGTVVVKDLSSATAATTDPKFAVAFDATMSKDGKIIYFTGVGTNGPGVFSVPAAGGTPAVIAEGQPFTAPFGIALSTDGKILYVADTAAAGPTEDRGRILSVSAEGGSAVPVAGSDDTAPRGIEVLVEGGADQLVFSGRSKASGAGALFKLPAAGGTVKELVAGPPLLDPEGIAITASGTIWVLDAIASGNKRAAIFSFDGTKLTEFTNDILVGYPSGLALTFDDKALVVSSLDPKTGGSSLLIVDILSKESKRFPTDASFNGKQEPGGLHRARGANEFAWVSYDPAGPSVYAVK